MADELDGTAVTRAMDAANDLQMLAQSEQPPVLQEFGVTGLKRVGGFIGDEYLTQLRGINGVRVWDEMSTNDPIAGGMMFAINRILQRLPWDIEPGDQDATADDLFATAFIKSCMDDMETPWNDVLEDVLSMSTYGWAFLEMNLKLRQGVDAPYDFQRSQFTDGRLGWRSFRLRSQDTLLKWEYGENGELLGLTQIDPNGGHVRTIPSGKALLFRTTSYKDNPEGRSLLRAAYRPWYYKKRIEDFEGIGIERDLAGLPVATLPVEYFNPAAGPEHIATLQTMKQLVSDIRQDANGGVVIPAAYDDKGHRVIDLQLLSSSGTKNFDTNAIITRKSNEMATSILMDFMMLGQSNVGSFSLGAAKIDLWTMAVESVARQIAQTFQKSAIKRTLDWNRIPYDHLPKLSYGQIDQVDLPTLGAFIQQMVAAGVMTPDPSLDEFVRDAAKIPAAVQDPDDLASSENPY